MYEYNLIDKIVDAGEECFVGLMNSQNNVASLKKGKRVINLIDLNSLPERVKNQFIATYGGGLAFTVKCTEDGKTIHVVVCELDNQFMLHHELGHIVLGHTKHYLKQALKGRYPREEDVLEMEYEADEAAASIIGPLEAMYALSRIMNKVGKTMDLSAWFMAQKRLLRLKSMIP